MVDTPDIPHPRDTQFNIFEGACDSKMLNQAVSMVIAYSKNGMLGYILPQIGSSIDYDGNPAFRPDEAVAAMAAAVSYARHHNLDSFSQVPRDVITRDGEIIWHEYWKTWSQNPNNHQGNRIRTPAR